MPSEGTNTAIDHVQMLRDELSALTERVNEILYGDPSSKNSVNYRAYFDDLNTRIQTLQDSVPSEDDKKLLKDTLNLSAARLSSLESERLTDLQKSEISDRANHVEARLTALENNQPVPVAKPSARETLLASASQQQTQKDADKELKAALDALLHKLSKEEADAVKAEQKEWSGQRESLKQEPNKYLECTQARTSYLAQEKDNS